ncbi:MAG: MotA/TolQ/ExbB proton channel family protein [Candidatus Marinimicrobia bacterium]|nr:MotA/TolQ/ExbB proton channel family protein [Candidatus Neomarinimicrobiota bacterium]
MLVEKFLQGGAFMWPILICGIAGIAFAIERLYHLLKSDIAVDEFSQEITDVLKSSGVRPARDKCEEVSGPLGNIYMAALDHVGMGVASAEKAIENRGSIEMANLEKNMSWITFFIGTAPMLGFLGTVVGMIKAFDDIKVQNDISPAVVAGGISIALLTTAFGLIVAVILQFFQNLALNMIEGHILSMEKGSEALVETFMVLDHDGKLKN